MMKRAAKLCIVIALGLIGSLSQSVAAESFHGPVVTVSTSCGDARSYTAQLEVDRMRRGFRIKLSSGRMVVATRVAPHVYRGTSRSRASRFGGREVTSYLVRDQGVLGLYLRAITKVRHGQYSCTYTDQVQLVRGS